MSGTNLLWDFPQVAAAFQDDCVEILNKVVCEYEHMWTKSLGDMTVSGLVSNWFHAL